MTNRDQLIARIDYQNATTRGLNLPIVSLEEFFDGNEDYGSIGCNLDMPYDEPPPETRGWLRRLVRPEPIRPMPTAPHPGPQGFFQILKSVRDREEVRDVLIEISDSDTWPGWPFSEHIYILTRASVAEVEDWVATLFPDPIEEGFVGDKSPFAPEPFPGYHVYSIWWD